MNESLYLFILLYVAISNDDDKLQFNILLTVTNYNEAIIKNLY